ncbi:retention module-containing protein [Billgrantia bachuensis]|uniref:Retention module-containing protein n=1 Tax=Billgrantia bachuensis TaxID=2717286 RepID=A0ABX0PLR9_9GAMM|nr:retention module-containing protein [Halomonas bachuensis]NIC04220.1 retention module-containing protein [Halomonas bachuensis]
MAIATVISITGQAWARDAEGNLRELRVGDTLQEGEVLITSDNGSAQLDFADGLDPALVEGGEQVVMTPELDADEAADVSEFAALDEDLEALLTALDDDSVDLLDVLDATAAGAGLGGGADGGHTFVRLARIAEDVNPLAFEYGLGQESDLPEVEGAFFEIVEPSAGVLAASLFDAEIPEAAGSVVTGVLPFSFGTGVNGSVTFADMDGVQAQIGQESITFSWNASNNTLTAFSTARELNIFTIEVNPGTGAFTLTQLNSLLHEEGMDEALASLVYTVTSTSGTATGTLNITILDDAPSLELGSVDLSDVALETQDSETLGGTSIATGSVAAAFDAAVNAQYGADGAGSTFIDGYALTLGDVQHSLTSGGEPIVFELVDGVVIGTADGNEVLRIELDAATGAVTVTQSGPVDHAEQGVDSVGLPAGLVGVTATVTVTDADGDVVSDSLSADLSGSITVVDDMPSVELGSVDLSDVALETQDSETLDGTSIATGSVAAAFSAAVNAQYGADGAGSTVIDGYALTLGDVQHGLTSGGEPIVFELVDGVVIGTADGNEVLRIELDAATGAVTVTQSGPVDHAEQGVDSVGLPAGLVGVTATVTVTDADGDVVSDSLSADLSGSITIVDDIPVVEGTDPSGHEVVITNLNSLAGYNNSFGYYIKDENGNPTVGMVIWGNVKHDKGASYVLEGYAPGEVGYFIIPNGANLNPGLENETDVNFVQVNGVWVAVTENGDQLNGQNANAPVLFNDPTLNPGGASHVENNAEEGDINWEDVYGGGDKDYNDVNIKVEWTPANLTVDESNLDIDAEFDFSGYFSAEYGADGLETRDYSLSVVADGADSGLVDIQTGEAVLVKEVDGQIIGYVTIYGEEVPVFTLAVDGNGVVTLDQLRAIAHQGAGQVGASDAANILANVVFLTKTVTDSDGDVAKASIDIGKVIYFLDDGPTAVDNEAGLGAGEFELEQGNVLANDQLGADGGKVTAVNGINVPAEGTIAIPGQYGVLTIAADGTYTYVRNAGTPGGVSDSFTYTLTDGDGDSDTAVLTIAIGDAPVTIDNPTGAEGHHIVVNEAWLEGGTAAGQGELTQTGSFTINAPDGVKTLTVGGQAIVQNGQVVAELPTITTPGGNVLQITGYNPETGEVSYSYILNNAKTHGEGEDDLEQSFAIHVEDLDGSVANGELSVQILDDAPIAEDDSNSVAAGEFALVEDGNLLTNDKQGADGARVTEVNEVSVPAEGTVEIVGDHGVLTVAADGSYSYVRNAGTPGGVSDSFTYTLTDGDGDSDTATLTIDISDSPVDIDNGKPAGQDAHLIFNEAYLPGGTQEGDGPLVQNGSFTVSAPDGVLNLSVGGQFIVKDGVDQTLPTIVTEGGNTLAITGYTANGNGTYTINYEYTLNANKDHEQPADDESLTQSFQIVLVDTDGDTASNNLLVQILDDAPEFGTPDDASLGLDSDSTASGSLELTIGADADGAHISQAKLLADEQGYLQVRYEEDGVEKTTHLTSGGQKLVYVFDAENQQLIAYKEGEDSSNPVLTIDLSVGSNQYVVNVLQPLDPVAVSFTTETVANQGGGIDGELVISNPNLSAQFTGVGGAVNWSTNGIGVANNLIGAGQTLIAQFSQTLTSLSFEMGKTGALSWEVFSNGESIGTGNGTTASFPGGFDEIRFYGSSGGDQYNVNNFQGVFLDAELGFTLPVEVVAVDGDGDTTDASFNIGFEPGGAVDLPELPTILGLTDSDVTVNEQYLQGGTAEGEGVPADDGSFELSAPEGIEALLVAGTLQSGAGEQQGDKVKLNAGDLESLAAGNDIVIGTPEGNTLTLTGYDAGTGEVSYSFELGGAVEHETGEGRNEQTKEGIQVELVDGLGNIAYGTIDVVIVDDVPESFANVQAIQVPVSELEVGALNAGWGNVKGTSGSGNITTSSNASGVTMQWGGSSGSGYNFAYADGLTGSTGVATDSLFSLGNFTHNNFVISSGQKTLDTAELEVTFKVMIDGVLTEVTTTIKLKHEETPNNKTPATHPDNDDIIKIVNPEQEQVITVGDREYVLKIRGFLDADGNLVDTVYTTETQATSFELFAEIASTDDLPSVEGRVDTDWGADGPAEEDSLLWANGEGGTLASGTVEGQFGTLTVNADGSYTYVVSRSARDGMKAGDSFQEEFTYYLTDADGDVVASKLTINLEGVENPVDIDRIGQPEVQVTLDGPADLVLRVDNGNAQSEPKGFTLAAYYLQGSRNWKEADVSKASMGFGVDRDGPSNSGAAESEIANGQRLEVRFDQEVSETTFQLAWLRNDEYAKYTVRYDDGTSSSTIVNGNTAEGGHDGIGAEIKVSAPEGKKIVGIDFATPTSGETGHGVGNDYVVHQVSYTTAELYAIEVDITLAEDNVSDKVVSVMLSGVPVGATLSVGDDNGDGTWTLPLEGESGYSVVLENGKLTISGLTLEVPVGYQGPVEVDATVTVQGGDSLAILGGAFDDTLMGGDGDDLLIGGAGDDTLLGGLGADTFVWNLGDQGEEGEAATDTVKDFSLAEGDSLDLSDLLSDGSGPEHLRFEAEEGGSTTLYVSTEGNFGSNADSFEKSLADQVIVLENFNGDLDALKANLNID